jgi:hypothetical protein
LYGGRLHLLLRGLFHPHEHPTHIQGMVIRQCEFVTMKSVRLSQQPFHAIAIHRVMEALFGD